MTTEEEALLRQQVFERLNTGALSSVIKKLNRLYQGKFNNLLRDVARHPLFRAAWGVPQYSQQEELRLSEELAKNTNYIMMRDLEIALRFFALRHDNEYQKGMKGFLDLSHGARTFLR